MTDAKQEYKAASQVYAMKPEDPAALKRYSDARMHFQAFKALKDLGRFCEDLKSENAELKKELPALQLKRGATSISETFRDHPIAVD